MQATMHSTQPLQTLLCLTVKARESFERLRNFNKAFSYRVERCDSAGDFRWRVVAAGSARTVALRRTRREALLACDRFEGRDIRS